MESIFNELGVIQARQVALAHSLTGFLQKEEEEIKVQFSAVRNRCENLVRAQSTVRGILGTTEGANRLAIEGVPGGNLDGGCLSSFYTVIMC